MASSTTVRLFLPTPSTRRATLFSCQCAFLMRISTHALHEEGDLPLQPSPRGCWISTHALHEEGDRGICKGIPQRQNFYPRPPRGGRLAFITSSTPRKLFLPTPSTRRATLGFVQLLHHFLISTHALHEEGDDPGETVPPARTYFYPRPPRGGRHSRDYRNKNHHEFLPTPSTRRATLTDSTADCAQSISTHALHEEGDLGTAPLIQSDFTFLPTPSTRRATKAC